MYRISYLVGLAADCIVHGNIEDCIFRKSNCGQFIVIIPIHSLFQCDDTGRQSASLFLAENSAIQSIYTAGKRILFNLIGQIIFQRIDAGIQ